MFHITNQYWFGSQQPNTGLIWIDHILTFKAASYNHSSMIQPYDQWSFQEPIDWRYLPYIRPTYIRPCKGISPQNIALYGTVPPF
jgi:hypothetical protein